MFFTKNIEDESNISPDNNLHIREVKTTKNPLKKYKSSKVKTPPSSLKENVKGN